MQGVMNEAPSGAGTAPQGAPPALRLQRQLVRQPFLSPRPRPPLSRSLPHCPLADVLSPSSEDCLPFPRRVPSTGTGLL